MAAVKQISLLLVLGLLSSVSANGGHSRRILEGGDIECPPEGFDAVPGLDIDKYIAAPWYIQQQMPVVYQPEDELYCVRARYEKVNEDDISEGIRVYNYANKKQVNGEAVGTSGSGTDRSFFGDLRAIIPDTDVASKLKVGPAFLKTIFGTRAAQALYGDYWVVAVGESDDPEIGYDWAIVSGGAPKQKAEGGCRTGNRFLTRFQVNGAGFWLFSRKQVDPENTKVMRKVAKDLGFDLSVLKDVAQEGCEYEGAL